MVLLLLLCYIVPVYLVFFHFKVLPFTRFWKIIVTTPPVAGLLFLWFAFGHYTPAAQDAYAQANVVQIAAQVSGPVVKVHVTDNAIVKKGDPLFEIDSAPYRHTFLQAQAKWIEAQETAVGLLGSLASANAVIEQGEATLEAARQNVVGAKANIQAAVAATAKAKAQLDLAEVDLKRYSSIVGTGAVTQQQVDKAARNVESAKASLEQGQQAEIAARAALAGAESQALAADATVSQARAERRKIQVQIDPIGTVQEVLARGAMKSPDKVITDKVGQLLDKAKVAAEILHGRLPSVIQAEEAMNQAKYNLDRTMVAAPCDGVVGQVQLSVGTFVGAGLPVMAVTDPSQWRLRAPIPENWLELVRPGDKVLYSLRNYPLRVRKGTVDAVNRGVIHGQGVPSGNLPDSDARRIRTTDTPDGQSDFFVTVLLSDDQPDQPLRVGATGRVTIFAGGGFPVVNTIATVLHYVSSLSDYFFPKPSLVTILVIVGAIAGVGYLIRRRKAKKAEAQA